MITQRPEIAALIVDWYRRIAAGDMVAAAEEMLSPEPGFAVIGTDPGEWMDDRAALIRAYGEVARLGPPAIDVLRIEAYGEGTVAWVVDRVRFRRPNGAEKEMRHTFVLHQESDRWRVVHAHYSFGLPEQSAAPKAQ